jgi:hypothetical protein
VVSRATSIETTTAMMYTCKVLFRKGELMCYSFGNTKKQAERNASVEALRFLA